MVRGSAFIPPSFEPRSGNLHQLRGGGNIPICVSNVGMANVGRQCEHALINVDAFSVPTDKTTSYESMTKIMDTGMGMSAAGAPTQFLAKDAERILQLLHGNRMAAVEDEERVCSSTQEIAVPPAYILP